MIQKPLYITHDEGIDTLELNAIIDGAIETIQSTGHADYIPIKNFGVWRKSDLPYESVDWFLLRGAETTIREGQLNAQTIVNCIGIEPIRKTHPHFDLMATCQHLQSGYEDNSFVIGGAHNGTGTIISTYMFRNLDDRTKYECVKTEVLHELGHVFGAAKEPGRQNTEMNLGSHCTNICVMRQGTVVPND